MQITSLALCNLKAEAQHPKYQRPQSRKGQAHEAFFFWTRVGSLHPTYASVVAELTRPVLVKQLGHQHGRAILDRDLNIEFDKLYDTT